METSKQQTTWIDHLIRQYEWIPRQTDGFLIRSFDTTVEKFYLSFFFFFLCYELIEHAQIK
jgi:hypothetical protein